MKRTVNFLGFAAAFTLSTGIMFKVMQWPMATILLFAGFILLNFGFLPSYFYQKNRAV